MISEEALCIIPARGGSKRIPRKNLKELGGRPLIAYTVDAALQSGVFSEVVVSSDDAEILDVARILGASVDERPARLAGDQIRFVQVVEEYLTRTGIEAGLVAGMLPTCPFRALEDIREPLNMYEDHGEEPFVISVTRYDFPPQLALRKAEEEGDLMKMREPDEYARTTRSQSMVPLYHPNGAIYIASVENFRRDETFFSSPLIGYEMPRDRSFDIDYPIDFAIAEQFLRSSEKETELA